MTNKNETPVLDPNDIKDLPSLYRAISTELERGTEANATRIAALESQLSEIRAANEENAKATGGRPDMSIGYKPTGNPEKDWNWLRFLDGVTNDWKKGTEKYPEREISFEATEKAQTAGLDTGGGFLVAPEIFTEQIIPALEPKVVMLAAGATLVSGLVGSPVEWPRWDDTLTGYWIGEEEEPTEGQLALSQMSLTPKGVGGLVQLTQRLLRQTSNRVEMAVRDALARGLARKIDLGAFKGQGGKQPVGIVSQRNVGEVDADDYSFASGAAQEVTAFLEDMIGSLEDADALMGSPVWFMHPATRRWFMKYRDAAGRPLLFETDAQPVSSTASSRASGFYGYRHFSTTGLAGNSADADLVFANTDEVVVGQWGGLLVETDRSLGFKNGTVWVKAHMEIDVGLRHGEGVSVAANLDTTTTP